ncbi:hypothetical protein [Actinoplanes sp. CA-252034]|uniref:hypothetical protein n=1 Tax=Actinoplanes sp. CA-252034 TaxID=3239906 RepID=UPI003D95A35A
MSALTGRLLPAPLPDAVEALTRHLAGRAAPVVLPALPSGFTSGPGAVVATMPDDGGLPGLRVPGGVNAPSAQHVVAPEATPVPPSWASARPGVPPRDRTHLAPLDGAQPTAAPARKDRAVTLPGRPAAPPGPGGQSAGAGQPRDTGGGNAPTTSTVPASWWPVPPTAIVISLTDVSVTGRSVRYSGPPS